ncbi:MAG: hypothetical protein NTV60_03005, partial [Candidatus Kaiserbacteria bacterium]|nr:hypothetical protein [Candidatus Kaiserbacteria bacterium]
YGGTGANSYGTQAFTTSACATGGAGMFTDGTIQKALAGALAASGGTAGNLACVSAGTSYAVAVKLNTSPASWWCVDYTGAGKSVVTSVTAFPTATFTCP